MRRVHFWKNWILTENKDMIPSMTCGFYSHWDFLALSPVSCGIAHGWHRRQGLQRPTMDSKTRWQLRNNDPGRYQGNSGLEKNRKLLFNFPSLMDTQWKKIQLHIPSGEAVAWRRLIFRRHKASCRVVSWTMWSSRSHWLWNSHDQWINGQGNVALCHSNVFIMNESCKSRGVFKSCFKNLLFLACVRSTCEILHYIYICVYLWNP